VTFKHVFYFNIFSESSFMLDAPAPANPGLERLMAVTPPWTAPEP
jgi:uncharacterized protein (DUF1778 family)